MSGRERAGAAFWVAVAVGGALMGWGAVLYLDATPDARRRIDFAKWLVGLDVLHDALLAPLVLLAGLAVARLVPGRGRAPVQAGLIVSALVLLVALPPLMDTAAVSNNPTIQPLDYTTATLTVLGLVWAAVAVWAGIRLRRRPAARAVRATR